MQQAIFIDTSKPHLDWIENPEYLESSKSMTRYLIPASEQNQAFSESEWFCNDCGALIEDTDEGCQSCNQE